MSWLFDPSVTKIQLLSSFQFVSNPPNLSHVCIMHISVFLSFQPLQPSSPTAQSPSSRHQFSPLLPSSPSSSSSFSPPGSPPVRISVERTDPPQSASTVSYLVIRDARPSESGVYHCSPSNTKPASLAVHVLDGKWTMIKYKYRHIRLDSSLGHNGISFRKFKEAFILNFVMPYAMY